MNTLDLNRPLSAHALNESMFKKFNVRINFDKYTREDLENYRNLLRTKVHAQEVSANFNDLLTNETYQKDKYMLGVINTKIKEMLGESKLAEKAVSKAQQKFMGMVHAAQKGEKPASKEVAKAAKGMSKKAAKDFASTKHKGLPEKKTAEEGIEENTMKTTEAKKAKPDFLDMDKDGNKKEPMKKAIADKKKKPFAKANEAKKPLVGGQKKLDTDKDGDIDATDMKNLRAKKKVKESKAELMHLAYQQFIAEGIANYIAEDEEGKAKSITAAADMVNDFTSWMQRVGNYQTKSMIELADNIRANFGMQEAEQFKQSVAGALEGALNALTQAREEINNAVAVLAGEAPAENPMGMDAGMDGGMGDGEMDMEPAGDDMMNPAGEDEFAASDAAAGGPDTTGRMKRESIERGNRLMKILGA